MSRGDRKSHFVSAFCGIRQFGGCLIKWLYSAYPTGGTFGLDPRPENETLALIYWYWLKGTAE